jgi:copper resistance protein D
VQILLVFCMALHAGALAYAFGARSLDRFFELPLTDREASHCHLALAVALASALVWPALQTGYVLEDPGAALDPRRVIEILTGTSFGNAWLARIGLVAAAFALSWNAGIAASRFAFFALAAALASIAMVGHAAAASGATGGIARFTMAAHLLGAGAWFGALPVLHRRAVDTPAQDLAQLLRAFSRYGAVIVAIIVASGLAGAWINGLRPQAVLDADYGRILCVKLALVAVMGGAALMNRNRFTPKLDGDPAQVAAAREGLCRSIGIEGIAGAAVIVVASILGFTETPVA